MRASLLSEISSLLVLRYLQITTTYIYLHFNSKFLSIFHAINLFYFVLYLQKDKASVLANTKDYLNTLKAEISELKQKNEILEKKLLFADEIPENVDDDSNEKFKVQITRLSESTSQGQRITLTIDVREECDIIVFILRVLECLKSMSFINLVSINASTLPPHMHMFARGTLTLQIEVSN